VSGKHAELVSRLVEDDYKQDCKKMKFDNEIAKYFERRGVLYLCLTIEKLFGETAGTTIKQCGHNQI